MNVFSRVEYRALEGFVLAVSPFNFTAIGGNLPGVPALVGNVVLWKPSPAATYSNYVVYQLLEEAGVPPGVIQFVPGPPAEVVAQAISHPLFAGLHFTGSTAIFKKLWKDIAQNLDIYRSYPRIVGETGVWGSRSGRALSDLLIIFSLGGKNFHVVHSSADVENAVFQSVRSAFEYQGALGKASKSGTFSHPHRPKMFCSLEVICFFLGMERRGFQGQAPGASCGDQGRQPHEA